VSDFLEFARRPRPELGDVDVRALLVELRDLAAADAAAGEVTLAVAPGDAPRAAADATQLRRAILNLVRNAIQATAAGGTVTLSAAAKDGKVRLTVADTGKGMPAAEIEKIFVPFYTTKEQGTGLGLAFVKEIVADHGGTLSVDSKVGAGTTFTIEVTEFRPWASS
jgi:signal transduction histidine kinase